MPPDIAVIDSGINPDHIHVQQVAGGHGYRIDAAGRIEKHPAFMDEIGHGTAIAGIIREKAPFADLYGIKIFQKELAASASILMAALEWAIEEKIKIIHLSLGTQAQAYKEDIEALCNTAYEQDIIIIAAARSPRDLVFPAAFNTVVGVFWDPDCTADAISYHPGEIIEFGAHGWPRALPGMPQEMNFRGNSFAVAHVTGKIAQIVKRNPALKPADLKKELLQ